MRAFLLISAALFACSCVQTDDKQQLLDRAISTHGGYEKLQAASTWVAEVRRYQRGESYEIRNYYRPGMIRLEMDLGNGARSADVIGHPHCWGKSGPMTFPCSAETRENDRPRVVMEMAAQIWPLRGDSWTLLGTSVESVAGSQLDVLLARYEPLDSHVTLRFRQDTGLLHSISVDGIKGGNMGTHTHEYSKFEESCEVLMPTHNVKSFEGDVWVEEDILHLECTDIDEAMFVRPEQVAEGYIDERMGEESTFICSTEIGAESKGLMQRHIDEGGSEQFCVAGGSDADDSAITSTIPASMQLSTYSLRATSAKTTEMIETLRDAARARDYEMNWPVRVVTYDNDGMGLTGEIVVEATIAVDKKP